MAVGRGAGWRKAVTADNSRMDGAPQPLGAPQPRPGPPRAAHLGVTLWVSDEGSHIPSEG